MAVSEPGLWDLVRTHIFPWRDEIDTDVTPWRQCQSFEENLRKSGDWTDVSAMRLVEEYRRFLYLKALDGGTLTPPVAIDAAWHLHLSFEKDYARFCNDVLGRKISHDQNLTAQQRHDAYQRLLKLYDAEFGLRPQDIWPDHGGALMLLTSRPYWAFPWLVLVWMPAAMVVYVGIGAFAGWPMKYATPSMFGLAVAAIFYLLKWVDAGPERLMERLKNLSLSA